MLPGWLKKSSLGMSIVLGAATWLILSLIWINSRRGGAVYAVLWSLLMPGYTAGRFVGSLFFPNEARYGTTGLYAVPLFGILGDFILFVITWYFCLRLKRAFEPQDINSQVTSDYGSIQTRRRRRRLTKHFDGEHEPTYEPKQNYGRFLLFAQL